MGEKIRMLRKSKNMTQDKLAELSGLSRQTVNAIETGNAENVTTGTLESIAKALGVSVKDFF